MGTLQPSPGCHVQLSVRLFDMTSQKPQVSFSCIRSGCTHPIWAADGQPFAFRDIFGPYILDAASGQLCAVTTPVQDAICHGLAWSPKSWGASHLLYCLDRAPVLYDAMAQKHVSGELPCLGLQEISHISWSQHGLAVLSHLQVQLCAIESCHGRLDVRLGPLIPLLGPPEGLLLSPDGLHICSLMPVSKGTGRWQGELGTAFSLELLLCNLQTHSQALIVMPELIHIQRDWPVLDLRKYVATHMVRCSWSASGCSLAMSVSDERAGHYVRKISFIH